MSGLEEVVALADVDGEDRVLQLDPVPSRSECGAGHEGLPRRPPRRPPKGCQHGPLHPGEHEPVAVECLRVAMTWRSGCGPRLGGVSMTPLSLRSQLFRISVSSSDMTRRTSALGCVNMPRARSAPTRSVLQLSPR